MAKTTPYSVTEWNTLHKNGPWDLKLRLKTELMGNSVNVTSFDRYNDAASEIQKLLGDARTNQEGFRAYGSKWSMSRIAHQKDRMHMNAFMNLDLPVGQQDKHQDSPYEAENLYFFQCGNTISEISQALGREGKSLKTSGASNGQTIAGCISTGVHGSGLDVGSVQDFVVGLSLIIGDGPNDVVYIERQSAPALNNAFAQKINSRVIRNDDLFNAALVGLGSFGFIHGVVIEAEDLFLIKRYVKRIDKTEALKLAETLDFKNSNFSINGETDENGDPLRPWHYKVFINPYTKDEDDGGKYVVEVMYKKKYFTPYPDPLDKIASSIYTDLIYLLVKIGERFPKKIPKFIKRLEKAVLPKVDEETTGTLYETFWDTNYKGRAYAFAFGVDHKDSPKALNALIELTRKEGPIPGIYAMRFVKQSEATLAFTKFPVTCMIEIDGIQWTEKDKIPSMEEFSKMMIETLVNLNIDFTIHWGKNADWKFPNLVHKMYGHKVDIWKSERENLLSPEMLKVFTNSFLETAKLNHSSIV